MPDRTMEQLMTAIDHLLDDFDAICRDAVVKYRSYPAEFIVEHDRRAAASNVYCHMLADAERRFLDQPKIIQKDIKGLKVWIVGKDAVIRFKKMDEDGRSRNYPTKQAKSYDLGATLPGLPPPAARLSVGYWLDPTETEVERVQVSRPLGRSVDWCAAIVRAGDRPIVGKRWIDVTRQARGW
jgi:hypothetical protein